MKIYKLVLILVLLIPLKSYAVLNIGWCPTPTGPIGVKPCDLNCAGAAMVSESTKLILKVTGFKVKFVKIQVNTDICKVNSSVASLNFKAKASTLNNKNTIYLKTHNLSVINKLTDLVSFFDLAFSVMSETVTQLSLSKSNNLKINIQSFMKVTEKIINDQETPHRNNEIPAFYKVATSKQKNLNAILNINENNRYKWLRENQINNFITQKQNNSLTNTQIKNNEKQTLLSTMSDYENLKTFYESVDVINDPLMFGKINYQLNERDLQGVYLYEMHKKNKLRKIMYDLLVHKRIGRVFNETFE